MAAPREDPRGQHAGALAPALELFNETLVRRGFATVTTYPPNVKYVDRFRLQRDARDADRGVWGRCEFLQRTSELPPPVEPPSSGFVPPGPGEGGCDRQHYPDVCIPPYPPDLNCDDVERLGYSDFKVKPPDPHGFDEVSADDPDVIGCES